ncbi:MAG: anti-sigma factor [Pseudomonadota bacterium]
MTLETRSPEDDRALAGEYALGLLTGEDLLEARQRAGDELAFAAMVTDWEISLAAFTEELPPEEPGPAVKSVLLARMFHEPDKKPVWQSLWVWRTVTALSVVVLALVTAFDFAGKAPSSGPLYTAEIAAAAGDFRVVAVVDKSSNEVIMTRTLGEAPEGRILQVWAHGPDAPAISVGVWPEGETIRLAMPPAIAAVEGVLTLGVSEEPPGGSLTGSPSGRVFGTVDVPGVIGVF